MVRSSSAEQVQRTRGGPPPPPPAAATLPRGSASKAAVAPVGSKEATRGTDRDKLRCKLQSSAFKALLLQGGGASSAVAAAAASTSWADWAASQEEAAATELWERERGSLHAHIDSTVSGCCGRHLDGGAASGVPFATLDPETLAAAATAAAAATSSSSSSSAPVAADALRAMLWARIGGGAGCGSWAT
eukprot:GHVU01122731.1.p1 GENE.GHVU01122731.1~~GHVU01122731.1.p1  ORF type:complete len:189 (+),score=55.27 GHVU01122731.1:475-1041(+)